KDLSACIKIVGAQWNPQNVSQILKLRCAYLNKILA
ncbi:MAG: ISKra4 family transposase, partial [Cyanobacteria bacterium P01_E01_bin.35]